MGQILTLSGWAKGEPGQLLRQLSPITPRAEPRAHGPPLSLLTACAWLVAFPATPLLKGRDPSFIHLLDSPIFSTEHGTWRGARLVRSLSLLDSRAEFLSDLLISSVWHSAHMH